MVLSKKRENDDNGSITVGVMVAANVGVGETTLFLATLTISGW